MTIATSDKKDVVQALRGLEGRVHRLDIKTAIRQLRMASGTGSSRLFTVSLVAGQATQPPVNSNRRAVIAGSNLHAGKRRVALVAERLTDVGTDFDRSLPITHDGRWPRDT